jgi:hypothetical protein
MGLIAEVTVKVTSVCRMKFSLEESGEFLFGLQSIENTKVVLHVSSRTKYHGARPLYGSAYISNISRENKKSN